MKDLPVSIGAVRNAAAAIKGVIAHSPLIAAPVLSKLTGAEIHLKLETLHRTGSFKERGALAKLSTLSPAECRSGVVAMSAGNHAQGVAYHARRLGIPATIVMPEGTPFIKIDRTEAFGAKVVLRGGSLVAAREAADALAREQGLVLVHPYDDPDVIAGQGTIGLELLADGPDLDALVVPIGGGGLISGIAVATKALKSDIEIIGVQSQFYPSMYRLLRGEDPGPPVAVTTLAEGIAVKEPGRLTRQIVGALVADILLVDEAMLEAAVEILLERQKLVVEGAGAAGLAAVLAAPERFRGRRVGIVITGGNMDARLLASILMRGLVREGRLVRLRCELPDVPGALSHLSGVIGKHSGNIVEVHHQRLFHDTSVKRAELDVVVETQNRRHVEVLIAALIAAGFPTQLLLSSADDRQHPATLQSAVTGGHSLA
jgi:threonine dehydratase